MAHTRSFDKTDPADSEKSGLGAEEIRELKEDVEERMDLDHFWDNDNDTSNVDSDGHHKQVTLEKKSTAPTAMTDAGIVYVNDDTIAELHYKNDSADIQITYDGKIKRESLERDCTSCSISGSVAAGKIEFNTVNFDYESRWNSTDYAYEPEETGIYLIKIDLSDVTVGSYNNSAIDYGLKIYLNGSIYQTFQKHHQATCLMSLDDGDAVTIYSDKACNGADFFAMRLI